MNPVTKAEFDQRYQTHLKHLKLKGLQPKTIDAYILRCENGLLTYRWKNSKTNKPEQRTVSGHKR